VQSGPVGGGTMALYIVIALVILIVAVMTAD